MKFLRFDPNAWADYLYWQANDKVVLKRINALLQDIMRSPYEGIGKPEPLKHQYSGCWSRRITGEHRLVYIVDQTNITLLQCRFHY